MRQFQSLSIVFVVSLLSAMAVAGPPEDPSPTTQDQTLDGRTQEQGPNTQSQANPPSAPPPNPWGAPTIEVNPQIQVQVNPKLDVQANPQADADANADAKADAQANPNAEAKADIDTDIASEGAAPPENPPAGADVPPPTRVEVIHRPVPNVPPPRVDQPPRRRSGLMIAGLFTFGATYIGTALNGAHMYDQCDRARDSGACRQIATKMLIPVAGPFMAIQDSQVRSNQVKLGLLGGVQTAGALMTVVGAVMHIRDGKQTRYVNHDGVRVGARTRIAPLTGRGAGGLNLNVRF